MMSADPAGADGGGVGGVFIPKEDLIEALTNLGVSRNAATKALYLTGNYSADLAAAWIFENQDENIDKPFSPADVINADETNSDEDVVEDYVGDGSMYKMVFVVNSELGMTVGKVAGQVAHAAVGLYRNMIDEHARYGEMLLRWEQFGETKIVLKGQNAGHLRDLQGKATSLNLAAYGVQDAGRTQVVPGSLTVLGIMGKVKEVNQVTGSLPLL